MPDLFITEELLSRVPKTTDYLQEKIALQDLARQMATNPEGVLGLLVEQAMDITGATSAGISLYECDPAPGVFRWHHLKGELERFTGATTPRNYSPCGVTLDRSTVTLIRNPELGYSWVADAGITLEEVLLVPLYIGADTPAGTLWVTAQQPGYFDSGHARILSELAGFAAIALHVSRTERNLTAALEQQELLAREMAHRVGNVFAVFEGLTRMTARSATSVEDMALKLSGRVGSLGRAHALARPNPGEAIAGDLGALIKAIMRPYEDASDAQRIQTDGTPIEIGEIGITALALVFHELATNASKYGALSVARGRVRVSWDAADGQLVLVWKEEAGPAVPRDPVAGGSGFGTTLIDSSFGRLGGTILRRWNSDGLEVELSVPVDRL
jgi:two-component sensor histidine kinase